MAILKDSPIHISKLCKFDFLKDGLIPQVLQLTPDSIALIKISNHSLILPNGIKHNYKGCERFCVKTIPCASMFISSDFVLPALMTTCGNLTHGDQILYLTNLVILFSFFNSTQLSDFHSNLTSCHVVSRRVTSCHGMPRDVTVCHVMSRDVT